MRRNGQLSRVQAHFKRNRDREKIERALETLERLEAELAKHQYVVSHYLVTDFARKLRRDLTSSSQERKMSI